MGHLHEQLLCRLKVSNIVRVGQNPIRILNLQRIEQFGSASNRGNLRAFRSKLANQFPSYAARGSYDNGKSCFHRYKNGRFISDKANTTARAYPTKVMIRCLSLSTNDSGSPVSES